ncbi:MAG: hypothetical protein A2288_00360 [Candidatus Moranbacteria bacterium RIFOXYA12_FULL_44_15]|nr:MAG: hypothetical protein A2288_00360 [Candidatus Moranbacteria bacterium RIFOXYA12_FULL_44_15]OGI35246.1 MAG: hypothetical protein A2259_02995 [Candidatus Moranbacteria bacterium RIFOXYA2_FULL_43_15]
MNLNSILSKVGLSTAMAQDVTLLLVVLFVSFVFGMFIGRYKLITVLINIYVSFAILKTVPAEYIKNYDSELIFFFTSFIILTIVSKRLFEIYISGSGSGFLWRVFVMSFLEVVFLISITLSILPKKVALGYVSPTSYEYLASPVAQFVWMVVPLAFMFTIHKRLNR